jgi:hypothetical protein
MPDMTLITGIAASLNGMKVMAEGLLATRDINAMGSKVAELNSKIIEAQNLIFRIQADRAADIDKIKELEDEVARLNDWNTEKQRYEMRQIASGAFVYSLKPAMANGEPLHSLCATCYIRGKKSPLQSNGGSAVEILKCNECGAELRIRHNRGPFNVLPTGQHGPGGSQDWMR